MSETWVRGAVSFLVERQNGDGGWGELPDSYRAPSLAGRGPSMPPLTGLVLTGLIDAPARSPQMPSSTASRISSANSSLMAPGRMEIGSRPSSRPTRSTFWPEAAKHYPVEALAHWLGAGANVQG